MSTWYGLFVTGGTPKPIVDRLATELDRILKLPDVQARLRALGASRVRFTRSFRRHESRRI
jgi:tripartite-type tricarboxylate transporter receptor subunit TctC